MLLYRVFPFVATAGEGEPGHPLYEHHPQRGGRMDHPDYYVWYLAGQMSAAVGEVFGNLPVWEPTMLLFPALLDCSRALGVYYVPDDLRILDLDDPAELLARSLRPTQIVARNLAVTQAWAHRIWQEPDLADPRGRRWDAVKWWSFHRPHWDVIGSWVQPMIEAVEPLSMDHPAVRDAAETLSRVVPRSASTR